VDFFVHLASGRSVSRAVDVDSPVAIGGSGGE
jgi:hypothetical protein